MSNLPSFPNQVGTIESQKAGKWVFHFQEKAQISTGKWNPFSELQPVVSADLVAKIPFLWNYPNVCSGSKKRRAKMRVDDKRIGRGKQGKKTCKAIADSIAGYT